MSIPKFDDLPFLPDTKERHSWNVWGKEDELGSVNFIGQSQVLEGAALVTDGTTVSLSLPLNEPNPGLSDQRSPFVQSIRKGSHGRDDRLDGLYTQFSSQWDGLRHVRYSHHGFYGGRQDVDIDSGGKLGIEHWARHGIIGRGVLLDAKRFCDVHEVPLRAERKHSITAGELEAIAAWEGVEVRTGDIVMVRTGWLEWYLELDETERGALRGTVGTGPNPLQCPGLDAGQDTVRWLWNHQVGGVACDNHALESLPVDREIGFLHYRLIAMLGMAIGEHWWLKDLSRHCAKTDRYEFFFTSGILNLPGGCGSPTNAYAVF